MNSIEEMLDDLKLMPFPSELGGKKFDGIDPTDVNRLALNCINLFLQSGSLDSNNKENLNKTMSELRILNPKLVGDAQVYFGKLYRLCDLVYE